VTFVTYWMAEISSLPLLT